MSCAMRTDVLKVIFLSGAIWRARMSFLERQSLNHMQMSFNNNLTCKKADDRCAYVIPGVLSASRKEALTVTIRGTW